MLLRGIGNAAWPGHGVCVQQQTRASCSRRLHLAPLPAAARAAPGAPAESDQAAGTSETVVRRRGRPRKTDATDSSDLSTAAAAGPSEGLLEVPARRSRSKSAAAAEGAVTSRSGSAAASTRSGEAGPAGSKRRPLFVGTSTDPGSSSEGNSSSSSASERPASSNRASEEELRANVWSALSILKTSRRSALLPQQRVDRQPPSMPDLASTLRAEAGPRKGGKGGKASSKGGRRGKGKEIVLVAPPEERVERFRPPAPLPPEEEDPRVPESLEKLAAGDYTATKWILVQPRGTKRDYSRREVLGQEKVDALMAKYRAVKTQIPLGRRGASEQLKHAIQLQWRTAEVAKLRIHDDRSARDANLPRYNLVLRELEALTGGVVLDASGMSIWLYRGDNYVQPPAKPLKRLDTSNNFVQGWMRRGTMQEMGGEQCYVTGDASCATAILVLPDMFPLDSSEVFQACDRIAALGHLVVMPNLLERRSGTWPLKYYPPLSVRKQQLADWYRKGPGSIDVNRGPVKNVLCALMSWGEPPGGQRSALATLGFGWGGYIALRTANAEAMAPAPVKAGAALYPELFGVDALVAADIGVPVAILPAKHGPMERTMLCLQEGKPHLARRCLFKRSGKIQRGYATWAPAWEPKLAAQAWEFIRYAVQFIEHAWEGKVFVPPDDKGYKIDVGEGEEQEQEQGEQLQKAGEQEGAHQEQGQDQGDGLGPRNQE